MFALALIAFAIVIGSVLLVAAARPDTIDVRRTTTIQAPPEQLTRLIANFHNWGAWSPYEKLDPIMKRTFSGKTHGAGAVYAWEGNAKAGAGRMKIVDVSTSRVAIELDLVKPFETRNVAEFTFQPSGDTTMVTWSMRGPNRFFDKVAGIFLDFDRLIGRHFETGLGNLKAIAER
jgi:hypothetical protein